MESSNKNWGGRRPWAGRPQEYVKVSLKDIEEKKFLFLSRLSDRNPVVDLSVSLPCQSRGCESYTTQGIIQMVTHVWSVRPICTKHFNESQEITVESENQ